MKAPLHLQTARLVLSPPRVEEAAAIFERYASDAEVTRFLGWPRHQSIADTAAFLAFSAQEWERWPAGPYLIRSREDDRLLGSTGLAFETRDSAATGYVLAKDAWGWGYATEALRAMVDLARDLGVQRLYALCHPAHHASSRVLVKCGFVRDAGCARTGAFPNLAPDVAQPIDCYALTFAAVRGRS